MFKLFSRHSEPQDDTPDLLAELVDAQAELARLKEMPLTAFAEKTHKAQRFGPAGLITYSVDNKDDAIARAKAELAEIRARIKGSDLVLVRRKPSTVRKSAQENNTNLSEESETPKEPT